MTQVCIYTNMNACFEGVLPRHLIFSVLSSQVRNMQQQSCFRHKHTASQFTAWSLLLGKIAFYDCGRIQSLVVPQFPSPPCGFVRLF